MRVLVVEDEARVASFIAKGLEGAGFSTEVVGTGSEAVLRTLEGAPDIVLLDVGLPDIDGFSALAEIRMVDQSTPVIMLTARGDVGSRVRGLELGADDYLPKPFAFAELLARVQALMRRAGGKSEPTRLACADLSLDMISREVLRAGRRIELQPLEFSLLAYLMRNAGKVVSKTMIMEQVWNYNFDPQTNVVEARICRLRDKIDKDFEPKLLHTVRGVGYVVRQDR